MLFHFTYGFDHNNLTFRYGYVGIFLFFIISGFVIYLSIEGKDVRNFVWARILRLYPAYIAAILLSVVISKFAMTMPVFANSVYFHNISWREFLVNLTMFQRWLGAVDINGVFWTLAVELSFYLTIIVLKLLGLLAKPAPFITGFLVSMLLAKIFLLPSDLLFLYYPLLRYGGFFMIGMIMYRIHQGKAKIYDYLLLIFAFLIQAIYLLDVLEVFWALVATGVVYLVAKGKLQLLANKVLIFLGTISYSFYLIHENVAAFIFKILENTQYNHLLFKFSLSLLVVLLLASGITYLIERPINNFFKKK